MPSLQETFKASCSTHVEFDSEIVNLAQQVLERCHTAILDTGTFGHGLPEQVHAHAQSCYNRLADDIRVCGFMVAGCRFSLAQQDCECRMRLQSGTALLAFFTCPRGSRKALMVVIPNRNAPAPVFPLYCMPLTSGMLPWIVVLKLWTQLLHGLITTFIDSVTTRAA